MLPLDRLGRSRLIRTERLEMITNGFDFIGFFGATRRIRTGDLLITNQLLYQLS